MYKCINQQYNQYGINYRNWKIVAMIQRLNSNSTKSICVEMIFINEYSTLFAYIYDCVQIEQYVLNNQFNIQISTFKRTNPNTVYYTA